MLVEKEKIEKAKEAIADETPDLIAEMLQVEKWDSKNKKGCCVVHAEDTPSMVWDKKRNSFHCFGCNRNIDIIDAYMMKGDTYIQAVQKLFEKAGVTYAFGEVGIKKDRDYRYPHLEDCGSKDKVYSYLGMRCISPATIDAAGITQDDEGNICFNYVDTEDVLTMVKKRPSRKVKKGENKNWCQQGSDTAPVLFNMNRVNVSAPLVITEGEIDCLALIECGVTNSVSIPLGAGNTHWIEHNWDWLEQFDSIIVCFDNDTAGVKARKEVVPRLGSWRTKYVEIPHVYTTDDGKEVEVKDVNEVLYYAGRDAVLDLIDHAEDPGVPSVVNVSDIQDVDLDEMDGITTGIRELDVEVMKLFYGTLTIVSGKPGAGKSSFLSQLMCQSLEQDKPVWMFSREMPCWMMRNWLNFVMAGGHHVKEYEDSNGAKYYKIEPDAKSEISKYYDKKWFLYRDDWSNKFEDVMASMEDSVRKYGAKLLIVDNLMMLDLEQTEDSELLKQTECIEKLIKFAMKYSVAVVLVAHPKKLAEDEDVGLYSISGSSNIINLAHRSIGLRRINQEKEKSNYNVSLTIIKDRMRGRAGKKINLYYDVPTRRFYTNEREYGYQYGWDKGKYRPLPYPHTEEREVFGEVCSAL
ncbi:MAG: AAA family ATPase [Clostridia bacterium]|nr:AAA family ATPase [Clostridia bacterium]